MVDDKHTEKAHRLFKDADEKRVTIIASHLVLLELFDVIRKRIIENSQYNGISQNEKNELIRKWENKRTEVGEKISILWKQGNLVVKDPDIKIEDYYKTVYRYVLNGFGEIDKKEWCYDCKKPLPKIKYKYRGVGHWDMQHVVIAKNLEAKQFFTFDRGFSEVKKNDDFKSLEISIL